MKNVALLLTQRRVDPLHKGLQQQIQLQHAAPATPLETSVLQRLVVFDLFHVSHFQVERFNNIFLILPIALVGFKPLGHTLVQFMMV